EDHTPSSSASKDVALPVGRIRLAPYIRDRSCRPDFPRTVGIHYELRHAPYWQCLQGFSHHKLKQLRKRCLGPFSRSCGSSSDATGVPEWRERSHVRSLLRAAPRFPLHRTYLNGLGKCRSLEQRHWVPCS